MASWAKQNQRHNSWPVDRSHDHIRDYIIHDEAWALELATCLTIFILIFPWSMHALSTMYIIFSAPLFCTVILHNVLFFYIYNSTSHPNWIRYINSPLCLNCIILHSCVLRVIIILIHNAWFRLFIVVYWSCNCYPMA